MTTRLGLPAVLLVLAALLSGCTEPAGTSSDAGAGGADGGSTPGQGWTAVSLPNDTAKGLDLARGSADKIAAIHFQSLTAGFVATMSGKLSPDRGGAIYRMSGATTSSGVAFSGAQAISDTQNVSFQGLEVSGQKVFALTDREEAFVSSADYAAFTLVESGKSDLADVLWIAPTTGGTWWLLNGNQMALTAAQAPSPTTVWTTKLGPKTIPTVPDPYPSEWCAEGPADPNPGWPGRYAHMSGDGAHGAYAIAHVISGALQVCVFDGSKWTPRTLPNPPAGALVGGNLGPMHLGFVDDQHGWLVGGNEFQADSTYVYRTSDGGETWTAGTLPASLAGVVYLPHQVFFAPDLQHGWIVGFRGSGGAGYALLLASEDGGATWKDLSADGVNDLPGATRLYTGFALDASHLWVGGEGGFLAHSDKGGTK